MSRPASIIRLKIAARPKEDALYAAPNGTGSLIPFYCSLETMTVWVMPFSFSSLVALMMP